MQAERAEHKHSQYFLKDLSKEQKMTTQNFKLLLLTTQYSFA